MSMIEKAKAHPKTLLATVAIASLTVGFAGGLGIGKVASTTSTSQAALATAPTSYAKLGMTPPDQNGRGMMPPGQNGQLGSNGQGTTPSDVSSGASESTTDSSSNSSSDEVNALKQKNQEIKSQIAESNQ